MTGDVATQLYMDTTTTARPTQDLQTTGWSSTAPSAHAAINETTGVDTNYITSPLLGTGGSVIMDLDVPRPAGNWQIAVRAEYAGTSGQIRLSLLDASNNVVGVSSWQPILNSYAEYDFTITTSAMAFNVQIEVSQ